MFSVDFQCNFDYEESLVLASPKLFLCYDVDFIETSGYAIFFLSVQ